MTAPTETQPQPNQSSEWSGASYVWLALAGGAIFATCRFPSALPALARGFFYEGFGGAIFRVAQDAQGEDWLIAWLVYPAIGLILGGLKKIFSKTTNVARWMFLTTVVMAALFLAETIVVYLRHRN
jgi:hypothetical protein